MTSNMYQLAYMIKPNQDVKLINLVSPSHMPRITMYLLDAIVTQTLLQSTHPTLVNYSRLTLEDKMVTLEPEIAIT